LLLAWQNIRPTQAAKEDDPVSIQNDNDPGANAWGSGKHPPDLNEAIRRGGNSLKQMLPGGGLRGLIVLAALILAGLGAMALT
jgi:hypothetical protein